MCGIWAVFGSDEDVSVQCNAVHKITHRGPDAFRIENINHFQNCCLGFHQLSIMGDFLTMQPMRLYTHPHIWLIYNGEIYNYKALAEEHDFHLNTDCDGEAIIHLYAKYGMNFPAHLDGVFAFCLLDTANRKVFTGRDTFGVRPCFKLYTSSGFLAICSEAKGLFGLSHGLTDEEADIQPVHPGTVEEYSLDKRGFAMFNGKKQFHSIGEAPLYKTPVANDSLGTVPGCDVHKNIRVLLESAVKKRLMSERRVGCLLSGLAMFHPFSGDESEVSSLQFAGGLDSSLVASLLVKTAKKQNLRYPIQTFTVGMTGSPDILAAKKVATYLGTEHHEVIFTSEEAINVIDEVIKHVETYDIITVRPSIGMYLVSKYISEKTDTVVILSGEGSDELAQGYIYFQNAPTAEDADQESRRLLKDIYMYDVLRADRATAAWGLEIRVPFLDHQLTSYYLSLPPEDRIPKDGMEKHLVRSAFAKMNLLPSEILWRHKEGFSDGLASMEKSFYAIVQEYCDEKISNEELEDAPTLYPFNTPRTKEALYYRRIFEKYYPNKSSWMPYYWMPKWINATDPSARILKQYKQ